MSSTKFRGFIFVLVAFAVGASGLLVAESALADAALFRVEQRSHNFPNPPVTPGGAGMYQGYIIPYTLGIKGYVYPPETAMVAPFNPVGAARFGLLPGSRTSPGAAGR